MSKRDDIAPKPATARKIKTGILIVLAVVLAVIFLQNLADTPVQLLFWNVRLPLIVLLLIVAVAGFLIGWLIARMGRGRNRKKD